MANDCTISLIVAVADNGVIGAGNKIPWKCSSDMKFFRETTMGKPVIMGRKTWESLKQPLRGRKNIVISRNPEFDVEGATRVTSIDRALELAHRALGELDANEIMVIGGGAIYAQMLHNELSFRIYKTEIHLKPDGDTYFWPDEELHRLGYKEVSRTFLEAGPKDDADYSFVVLER